jgi:hypothetical protein
LTRLKAVYLFDKDDIEGIEIIKAVSGKDTERIKLSKFNFAQLKSFLNFISEIDLKGITERRLKIFDEQELDKDTIKSIKTLLSKDGGSDIVESLINEGIITSKDIVNSSFRKKGLQIFKRLISEKDYWKTYATENGKSTHSEEKIFQYFYEQKEPPR